MGWRAFWSTFINIVLNLNVNKGGWEIKTNVLSPIPADIRPEKPCAGWRAYRLLLNSTHQIRRETAAGQDCVKNENSRILGRVELGQRFAFGAGFCTQPMKSGRRRRLAKILSKANYSRSYST